MKPAGISTDAVELLSAKADGAVSTEASMAMPLRPARSDGVIFGSQVELRRDRGRSGDWPLRSLYVERMWTPVLGVGGVAVLRLLDDVLGERRRASMPMLELSRALGLGTSTLNKMLRRLMRFELIGWKDGVVIVPAWVRSLDEADRGRLPGVLARLHDELAALPDAARS